MEEKKYDSTDNIKPLVQESIFDQIWEQHKQKCEADMQKIFDEQNLTHNKDTYKGIEQTREAYKKIKEVIEHISKKRNRKIKKKNVYHQINTSDIHNDNSDSTDYFVFIKVAAVIFFFGSLLVGLAAQGVWGLLVLVGIAAILLYVQLQR